MLHGNPAQLWHELACPPDQPWRVLTLVLVWAQNMPVCCTGLLAALLSTCACCFEEFVTAEHMTALAVTQMRQGRVHLGKPCCIWITFPAAVTCLAVRTTSSQQAKVDTNAAW